MVFKKGTLRSCLALSLLVKGLFYKYATRKVANRRRFKGGNKDYTEGSGIGTQDAAPDTRNGFKGHLPEGHGRTRDWKEAAQDLPDRP